MPTIRILAVEDDRIQARLLRHQVQQVGYELVGVAASAAEAEARFVETDPDMVVLDIHLQGPVDGVEVALRLRKIRPVPLIFLTSDTLRSTFERALAAGPFAFLTKPYDEALFLRALEVAVANFAQQQQGTTAELANGGAVVPGALYVRENNRLLKVHFEDMQWVEADDSYIHLHTAARKYTVKISLREFETKLPPDRFLRVRRNALVQLAHIEKVDLSANVVWVQGVAVPVGVTYREELLRRLPRLR
jgi:DNA-binding LytR/AlgR family response regulator